MHLNWRLLALLGLISFALICLLNNLDLLFPGTSGGCLRGCEALSTTPAPVASLQQQHSKSASNSTKTSKQRETIKSESFHEPTRVTGAGETNIRRQAISKSRAAVRIQPQPLETNKTQVKTGAADISPPAARRAEPENDSQNNKTKPLDSSNFIEDDLAQDLDEAGDRQSPSSVKPTLAPVVVATTTPAPNQTTRPPKTTISPQFQVANQMQTQRSSTSAIKVIQSPSLSSPWRSSSTKPANPSGPANQISQQPQERDDESTTAALRRQFIAPANLVMPHGVLQNLVRDALSDLIAQEPRQIHFVRPLPQVLLGGGPTPSLEAIHNRLKQLESSSNQNQQTKKAQQKQTQNLVATASASAPSVSLPPLSQLLAPRNPFRLFASASTPLMSRHLHRGSQKKSTNNQNWAQPQPAASNKSPSFQQQHPFDPFDDVANPSGGSLYAHTPSVEQLEQLVREASRASGSRPAAILPAIVSAPSGPLPGFYIPAIESESESQVNELRLGESTASSSQIGSTSFASSKIPGTDYILHPDEVRAMINIGELAWRERAHSEQKLSASASHSAPAGLMQENHAENARDFAYIETPQTRPDNQQGMRLKPQQQPQLEPAATNVSLEHQLASHLSKQPATNNGFPAIIRVNDQDYVHWPLVKPHTESAPQQLINAAVGFIRPRDLPDSAYRQGRLITLASSPPLMIQPRPAQLIATSAAAAATNPIRLATQLNLDEIRQVEESILDALITSQAIRNQQRQAAMMQLQAAASRQIQSLAGRPQATNTKQSANQENSNANRFVRGFFSRRRSRRNSGQNDKKVAKTAHLSLPLIHVADFAPNYNDLPGETASESQLNLHRLTRPTLLLADQETNKPKLIIQDRVASSSSLSPSVSEGPLFGKRIPRLPSSAGQKEPRSHHLDSFLSLFKPEAPEVQPAGSDKSQLRLRFAQDYQAREGVPIYNNNVRAPGAPLEKGPTQSN